MADTSQSCAHELLDAVPVVMRFIRAEMRRHRAEGLSVPQFRCMAFLDRKEDASLGEVAGHLGLTPPTTSKLVDGLKDRRLLSRRASSADRRRITLALTADGRRMLESARGSTQESLAAVLSTLSCAELTTVSRAMAVLRRVFGALEIPAP